MVRTVNQDAILADPPVFVVADGVGGSESGEIASAIVVEEFAKLVACESLAPYHVADALEAAQDRILAMRAGRPVGAATTAVGAVEVTVDGENHWLVFNIGDSRIYRIDGTGAMIQLSVDHSHVQELIDAGVITSDEAVNHPERNLVTRALGSDEAFEPDFWLLPIFPGERLMICSDGLLRETPYDQIEALVREVRPASVAVEQLLGLSLASGARDNVSVIVVDVGEESAAAHERV